jgi:hypothetical protein
MSIKRQIIQVLLKAKNWPFNSEVHVLPDGLNQVIYSMIKLGLLILNPLIFKV